VIRYSEEVWATEFTPKLLDAVLRTVCAALPARTGGSELGKPFDYSTGDDWIGDVGPAMSVEAHEEYEQYKLGAAASGLTVQLVHYYYTTSNPNRHDTQRRSARVESFGWGAVVYFRARVGAWVDVSWQLPQNEHDAMFAAWTNFTTAHGFRASRPGNAVPVPPPHEEQTQTDNGSAG
jgi:hypothetical protein